MQFLLNYLDNALFPDTKKFLKYQNFYLSRLLEINSKLYKADECFYFALLCNHHAALTETILEYIKYEVNPKLDRLSQRKAMLFTRLLMDSYSPKNFPFLDLNFIKYSYKHNFSNLINGFANLVEDVNTGKFHYVNQKDFKFGEDIARTQGKVTFKNELFELLCYKSELQETKAIPILLIPANINKYYIFDLKKENSMIQWLIDNGYQVFVISWANPDKSSYNYSFSDYLTHGVNLAIKKITDEFGFKEVHKVGYCLGGIFAALSASIFKESSKIKSISFFTTQLNFSNPTDFSIFLEPQSWLQIKNKVDLQGMMSGYDMQHFFNFIKAKEMIYNYIIDSYFYAKPKPKIDFLCWNSDSTNITSKFYKEYIEFTYIKNLVAQPNKLIIDNKPINLEEIEIPTFFLGAINDHIVPWEDSYESMQLLKKSKKRFILGDSGHVAGVINHPSKNKYQYWINDDNLNTCPDKWKESAKEIKGSWWTNWLEWLNAQDNNLIKNKYGDIPNLGRAPGEYIFKKM